MTKLRIKGVPFRAAVGVALLLIGCGGCSGAQTNRTIPDTSPASERLHPALAEQPSASGDPPRASANRQAPASESAPPVPSSSSGMNTPDPNTPDERRQALEQAYATPRHRPPLADQPARLARIPVGTYRCKVSAEYRLRECRVERDGAGRTWLVIESGNLIAARGLLWDDGELLRFEGGLTDRLPFGCNSCQDRCFIEPGSCVCAPLPLPALRLCVGQPVRGEIRGGGSSWRGTLAYDQYSNRYEGEGTERRAVGYETSTETLELTLMK